MFENSTREDCILTPIFKGQVRAVIAWIAQFNADRILGYRNSIWVAASKTNIKDVLP